MMSPQAERSLVAAKVGDALATRGEATALLAVGVANLDARADTEGLGAGVDQGAARGSAVGVGQALTGDELATSTIADVVGTSGIGAEVGLNNLSAGASSRSIGLISSPGVARRATSIATSGGTISLEAASLLAVGGANLRAGADAEAVGAGVDQSTASGGAVGVAQTLASDELATSTIADVLLAVDVGAEVGLDDLLVLAGGKARSRVGGGDGEGKGADEGGELNHFCGCGVIVMQKIKATGYRLATVVWKRE